MFENPANGQLKEFVDVGVEYEASSKVNGSIGGENFMMSSLLSHHVIPESI